MRFLFLVRVIPGSWFTRASNVRASAAKALASRSFGFRLPPCLRRLQAPVRRLCHENVLRGGLDRRNSIQRREVASARTAPSTSLEVLLGEKGRHFFRQRSEDELIDGYTLSSSKLARALVKGIR